MTWFVLIARLLLASVFAFAAAGKLADRRSARQTITDFGIPTRLAAPVGGLLPFLELAIALMLIPVSSARWGALAALGLLSVFIAAMSFNLAHGKKPNCHCFGQLHSVPIGWPTVARNSVLGLFAGLVLWRGGENPDVTSGGIAGLVPLTWIALAVAFIALVVAVGEAWFLINLLPQQGRILLRLEKLEAALGLEAASGLAIGERAPDFELRDLANQKAGLARLRGSGRPLALFFTNPHCAPCDAFLPTIARWQSEHGEGITIAVISRDSIEVNRAKAAQHGLRNVLVQKEREVVEGYRIESTPAAVLISADGTIASKIAYGPERIEALLQQAVSETGRGAESIVPNGRDLDTAYLESRSIRLGQPAPALMLPDLDGRTTELAHFTGTSTLLLFWNPECGFCQQMLPTVKNWERQNDIAHPRLLVISRGSADANRTAGLLSPVLLDADGAAMRAFGITGTPMGVLVDESGRIASPVAVGAQALVTLMARNHAPVAIA